MGEDACIRLLTQLLTDSGAAWQNDGGWLRFRFQHGDMVWETACRVQAQAMLIYARYPFRVCSTQALAACNAANRQLVRGSLFLDREGVPEFRVRADLADPYGARERLADALEYSAGVIARFWGDLQAADQSGLGADPGVPAPVRDAQR